MLNLKNLQKKLNGQKIVSILDFDSKYWQVKVKEESKSTVTFIIP